MGEFVYLTDGVQVGIKPTIGSLVFKMRDIVSMFNDETKNKYNSYITFESNTENLNDRPNSVLCMYNDNNSGLLNGNGLPSFCNADGTINESKIVYKCVSYDGTTYASHPMFNNKHIPFTKERQLNLSFADTNGSMRSISVYLPSGYITGSFNCIALMLYDITDTNVAMSTFEVGTKLFNIDNGVNINSNEIINNTGTFSMLTGNKLSDDKLSVYSYDVNIVESGDNVYYIGNIDKVVCYNKVTKVSTDITIASMTINESLSFYKNGNYIFISDGVLASKIDTTNNNVISISVADCLLGINMFNSTKYIKKIYGIYLVSDSLNFTNSSIVNMFTNKCYNFNTSIDDKFISQNNLESRISNCTQLMGFVKLASSIDIDSKSSITTYIEDMMYT